jgi:hypothetical protein
MKTSALLGLFELLLIFSLPDSWAAPSGINRVTVPLETTQKNVRFIVFGDSRKTKPDRIDAQRGDITPQVRQNQAFNSFREKLFVQIADRLIQGQVDFTFFTGDFVWRGSDPAGWDEIRSFFPDVLREPSAGKIFPTLGNHEQWQKADEPDAIELYFSMFPNLKNGEKRHHNYSFSHGENLFVSLCSGHTNASTAVERLKQDAT